MNEFSLGGGGNGVTAGTDAAADAAAGLFKVL